MKRVICFHLYNDYSGSPKVLEMVLDALCQKGVQVDLFTSDTNGVLHELKSHANFRLHTYRYHFSGNSVVTMLKYAFVQVITFLLAFRFIFSKDTVFYINTLLPIGPALAGRMMCKRVVYHYHENADAKGFFYRLLASSMLILAHKIICVSHYQSAFIKRQDKVIIVANAIPKTLESALHPDIDNAFSRRSILMLGSLKIYKGTSEFVRLAQMLPQYLFTLVINDTKENIEKYIAERDIDVPANLSIYSRQSEISRFYNSSSLVLNLSNKNIFIETFGLTALEAMSAGLPVIVPTVGGIAEMVDDGVNGYKIDVQELDRIAQQINNILNDKELYTTLASNALKVSKKFSAESMINNILLYLDIK